MEESAATGVQKAKWRDSCTENWCQPALTNLRCLSAHPSGRVGLGAEAQASEIRPQGEDWDWLREDSLKGASALQLAGRESGEKSGPAGEARDHCLGCVRRGDSCSMGPQKAEHHLSELQRRAQAAAISLDPRDGYELLTLPPLSPRILCTNAGHYSHPPGGLCSTPLPGSHDPGTTSPGEHTAHLRLLQCHAGLCHARLAPHSNCDYHRAREP